MDEQWCDENNDELPEMYLVIAWFNCSSCVKIMNGPGFFMKQRQRLFIPRVLGVMEASCRDSESKELRPGTRQLSVVGAVRVAVRSSFMVTC
ncbi:unnamed protein product [Eruca vesicaria subsp. sativa]|uniref:Uncharacterized protein n=1 Tax=Eruca vesicaria subsp. sativa TaxID=29727 RepID=A0ABC8LLN6_ERUVS|nr:unnamed protein product [Eruca vesicaria subsp. sativa]